MAQRYLIERKKRGAADYYTLGIQEGQTMREAAAKVVADFVPGDSIRITLLSVTLNATLTNEGTWDTQRERL